MDGDQIKFETPLRFNKNTINFFPRYSMPSLLVCFLCGRERGVTSSAF